MKTRIGKYVVLALASVALVLAQQAAPSPSPVAKQPRPKSQKELEAIQAMFSAPDPDGRIAAAKTVLTKFADSEFQSLAYTMMAMSYQQKNAPDDMIASAEEVVKIDPKNFNAKLMIAGALAQRTKEFDLDKEEKLGRAEKLVKESQEDIKASLRPREDVTEAQWEGAKKDYNAQALETMGLIAMARKKNDDAIAFFKQSVETSSTPEGATMIRLAAVYNMQNRPDDALAVIEKLMALPDLHPTIKQFAQAERVRATQMKNAAKPAAAPPAAPAAAPPAAPPKP